MARSRTATEKVLSSTCARRALTVGTTTAILTIYEVTEQLFDPVTQIATITLVTSTNWPYQLTLTGIDGVTGWFVNSSAKIAGGAFRRVLPLFVDCTHSQAQPGRRSPTP